MLPLIFLLPKARTFGAALLQVLPCERGELEATRYQDGETHVRSMTPVKGRDVILVGALDAPDDRIMPLYMAACIARENGAKSIGLVLPYLPYAPRHGDHSREGESAARHFAKLLADCCDWLVTVDPLFDPINPDQGELAHTYPVPIRVAHAAPAIATWITVNVEQPILVAPNEENAAWVAELASLTKSPCHILRAAADGRISAPLPPFELEPGTRLQPVILDKLVSDGAAMLAALRALHGQTARPPICIAVHPLLVGDTYAAMLTSGMDKLVSCNTIAHPTNRINAAPAVAAQVLAFLRPMPGNAALNERECVPIS